MGHVLKITLNAMKLPLNVKTISRLGINHCKTASHFRTTSVLKRQKFAVKKESSENCENDCPANSNGDICSGRGKCKGSGDKQGAGTCECDEGNSGDLCNECGPRHFKSFGNDTYTMCSPCAVGCETCLSANDTDCLTCSAGFTVDKTPNPAAPAPEAPKEEGSEEKKEKEAADEEPKTVSCVDVNECVESSDLCPVGQYCPV